MKLVESDIPHDDEEVSQVRPQPRPEHRRVHVSLFVTLSVLVATIAVIYTVFPERHNEIITVAIEAHREGDAFTLESPNERQLGAWSVGVLGGKVPWPEDTALEIVGSRGLSILKRPAALVRYRGEGFHVSLMVTKARSPAPRKHRRTDEKELAISWRKGPWTFVAVGPKDQAESWKPFVGAP